MLRSVAGYQMYRRHVRQRVTAELALRFLLQNNEFPRSVHFCLTRAQSVLPTMPPRPGVASADSALPVQNRIALRAYELYLQRGGLDGHADEDWLQAEREMLPHQDR